MRQPKLFIEEPLDKQSKSLQPLDRKQCRPVKWLLITHCTLRQHLHVKGLSDNATSRKCEQAEEFSCRTLFYCRALAGHASAWFYLMDIRRTSVQKILALVLTGIFVGPYWSWGAQSGLSVRDGWCCPPPPPKSVQCNSAEQTGLGLYLVGAQFNSLPGHKLSCLAFPMIFFSLSRQMPG
jgi:hypothetical protein